MLNQHDPRLRLVVSCVSSPDMNGPEWPPLICSGAIVDTVPTVSPSDLGRVNLRYLARQKETVVITTVCVVLLTLSSEPGS